MIRAIAVDDEVPALNKMVKMLENSNMVEVIGAYKDPLEALELLTKTKVDVAFLDIVMQGTNGIELASKIIDLQEGISIVFVTAYNKYAVEAFGLHALDYLMKPVTAPRLKETISRIPLRNENSNIIKSVNIRCFGKFTVSNGKEDVKFRTEKAEELLAFVIDCRGRFISRNEIIDQLWADFDGERAIMHFNTTLHYVKKALSTYGIQILFTYERGGYRFEILAIDCDYIRILSYLEEEKPLSQNNIHEYEEIANVLKNEYLSGIDYDWIAIRRLQLEEEYYNLILEIADYYKSIFQYKKASKWLITGLKKEVLHRGINYKLIEILLLDHDRILALKYYDIYRRNLKKSMGQEPDSEITKLLRRI